jgi:predicted GNAT family acetyltransferase
MSDADRGGPSGTAPDEPPEPEQLELLDNAGAGRYELHLDGQLVGLVDYRRDGQDVVLPHTETSPGFGGRGLAGRLVGFALDDIRARGLHVVPACPFVADYIGKHPEYADLLA